MYMPIVCVYIYIYYILLYIYIISNFSKVLEHNDVHIYIL